MFLAAFRVVRIGSRIILEWIERHESVVEIHLSSLCFGQIKCYSLVGARWQHLDDRLVSDKSR